MADHNIEVTFVDVNTVDTTVPEEHRLEAHRGESVTWTFGPGGQRLEIMFTDFFPDGGLPSIRGISPFSNPLTPNGQTIGPGTISNTAANGLYIYKVLNNGQPLNWSRDLFTVGSFGGNFGGIIIRDPQGGRAQGAG